MAAIERERFEAGGVDVGAWRLTGRGGLRMRIGAFGAAILSLDVPDREGRHADVVLGYNASESYVRNPSYLGVVVGRYANRIAGARFGIDGREYGLDPNDGPNHLHGGSAGFSHVAWRGEAGERDGDPSVALEHTSPDGAAGYPGRVDVRVEYTLSAENRVVVDFSATTTADTHVGLAQHSYFNLAGHAAGDVLAHELEIRADRFLPVGDGLIPTGELRPVDGTPFDFRTPTPIGARIDMDDEQLTRGRGYDHCFVLRDAGVDAPADGSAMAGVLLAARVRDPRSGRVMLVHTSEPGVQLYTGNWLGDGLAGKGGAWYAQRAGLALETQHFPDSPNRPEFPSTLLRAGQEYRSRTVYSFEVG